jgi:hypothetical protein
VLTHQYLLTKRTINFILLNSENIGINTAIKSPTTTGVYLLDKIRGNAKIRIWTWPTENSFKYTNIE